jgi:hypothetical protein
MPGLFMRPLLVGTCLVQLKSTQLWRVLRGNLQKKFSFPKLTQLDFYQKALFKAKEVG